MVELSEDVRLISLEMLSVAISVMSRGSYVDVYLAAACLGVAQRLSNI